MRNNKNDLPLISYIIAGRKPILFLLFCVQPIKHPLDLVNERVHQSAASLPLNIYFPNDK